MKKTSSPPAYIECPFCSGVVKPKKGVIKCPECSAVFEWDELRDSVFVNRSDLRLPIEGTVCVRCGLVQDAGRICRHCGASLCKTLQ